MQLIHLNRPVPGEPPADIARTYVFLANLAAQEASGDPAASVSIDSVLTRLGGSAESDAVLLALVDDELTPVVAALGPWGLPMVPSTVRPGDEDRALEVAGLCHIAIPLLEDLDTLDVDVVFDAAYLPLPGERIGADALDVERRLLDAAGDIARSLGRRSIHYWVDRHENLPEGYDPAVEVHQVRIDIPAATPLIDAYPPRIDVSTAIVDNYGGDTSAAHSIAELLTRASADAYLGALPAEPICWTPQRLVDAAARLGDRCQEQFLATVIDDGQAVAACEFTYQRPDPANPTVAELGVVAVARTHRGRGLARHVLAAGIAELRRRHPSIVALYGSYAAGDAASVALLAPYRPRLLATCLGLVGTVAPVEPRVN
ncbi:GNAT family N-acetyltransferase [Corynebacterium uterequi]|uniref:Acetyltransferase (GNAT) family protein n=1 Tax=Corynebacterium uterequi TaxID=1072256 RepID=A0A0G3HD47_9CORY|nr:GNAT family N-acetyltransferase [Corynebacterium uterequi]AKK11296.1 acetyltransferase (GNAT) family protein [Corynebacterium uterequi]